MGAGCDEVSRSYLEFFLKKFTAEVEPNDKVVLNNCKVRAYLPYVYWCAKSCNLMLKLSVDDNPSLTNASKMIPDKERTVTEA
ncbi:hypothetical protein MTR67_036784 [Solanum verrucosum]|uniref:Uncharacterized protein n=1 Tax=Solanum verrucosum TaxID=315347 RepID=A0AAF0ZNM9_SOLVR|nr:hypothetical protein MTR67_036784 [Solanum verrucosum]